MTTSDAPTPTADHPLVEQVRDHYAETVRGILAGSTVPADDVAEGYRSADGRGYAALLYDEADRASLPQAAVLASLGCGNPIAVAELREGEVVLDLGSGGGIDVLLSAQRVGTTGFAYGIDMTDSTIPQAPSVLWSKQRSARSTHSASSIRARHSRAAARERGEGIVLGEVAQEAHDELRGDAELALRPVEGVGQP